jgi:small-conductance mechanosensitive channel
MFEFFTQYFYPFGGYVDGALVIALFFAISLVVSGIFKRTIHKLTKKTKTVLDDLIVKAINRPLLIGIVLVGFYIALTEVSFLSTYAAELELGFSIIFILLGAVTVVRIGNAIIEWYMTELSAKTKTKADEQFMPIVQKVLYGVIGLLAIFWILGQMGVEITTLIAAMGIGGLAVALALQDTLKEFFAGTHVIVDRPIRIGDYVELESGERGYVRDISWRSTKIEMLGSNMMVIPNSKIAASKLINYDMPSKEMSVVITVGVSYNSDLEKVEDLTVKVAKEVLKKTEGGKGDFEPFIRYKEFGDSNIMFSVILRVHTFVDRYRLTHEFIKALKKAYDKAGVEISWPVRKVYNYSARKW